MQNPSSLPDPARIKLEILKSGVKVSPELSSAPFLDFIFPKGVWASAARKDFNAADAVLSLVQEQEFSFLVGEGVRIHIEVRRYPDFYNSRTESQKPFGEVAGIRANYVALSPGAMAGAKRVSESEVLEVVRRSLVNGWAEYVSLCDIGSSGEGDLQRALTYVKAIKRHVDTHISLTAKFPNDASSVDEAYGAGADAVAYELSNHKTNFDHALHILKHAARIFSAGSVSTLLILDRKNEEFVEHSLEPLVGNGIYPILSYRSADGLVTDDPLEIGQAVKIFRRLGILMRRAKFGIGWVPHALAVIHSVDPFYLLPQGGFSIIRGLMRTIAGSRLAFGLSTVRRKLRVRER